MSDFERLMKDNREDGNFAKSWIEGGIVGKGEKRIVNSMQF